MSKTQSVNEVKKNGNVVEKKKNGKLSVKLYFDGKDGKTKQEFKEVSQIQNILNKYQKTGIVTHLAKHQGQYGDFTKVQSFQDAAVQLTNAVNTFMELPATIREKFENDASKLISFINDEKNFDEAVKLGLLQAKVEQTQAVGGEVKTEVKEEVKA